MMMATAMATAATVHVAPDGADTGAGTRDAPFRTLAKARDALRNAPGDAGAMRTVVLGGGIHRLSGTFELDARDANTTFRAADGQEARLSGGIQVAVEDLQPVADKTILERLPAEVRSKVVQLELPGEGPGDTSAWPERFRGYAGWPEIYLEGSALRLARWPNSGYARIAKVLDRGSRPRFDETPDRGGRFSYKEDNPGRWNLDQPVYLGGYWSYKWYDEFVRVESIDAGKKEIQMAAPHQYGLGGPSKGLYFAINLLEELDQPGEYVYDGKRNTLYMLLPAGAKGTLQVSMLKKPLIRITNTKNLSFSGITFENGCGDGIVIADSESVSLADCVIRQMSGTGVDIKGGRKCSVDKSRLETIGMTGISLDGGDRKTLTPSLHAVTNCRISNFARLIRTYHPAVHVKGVGQTVSNNHMHHAPHTAILFEGNDHQMTFNHIERVCLDTSDGGAIYCGRDWTLGGNRIHGNYIHHLGSGSHHHNFAIYLDDMAAGIEVSKNVVTDTDAAFLFGGGRSTVITDNLISGARKESIVFDARAAGWAKAHVAKPDGTMWVRLNAMPFASGVWNERFPYLAKIEDDAYAQPRRNTITGNLIFGSRAMKLHKVVSEHGTVRDNVISPAKPSIELKDGRLVISDENLKSYEAMRIGPSQ